VFRVVPEIRKGEATQYRSHIPFQFEEAATALYMRVKGRWINRAFPIWNKEIEEILVEEHKGTMIIVFVDWTIQYNIQIVLERMVRGEKTYHCFPSIRCPDHDVHLATPTFNDSMLSVEIIKN
jgi:hypothetical protein